MNFAQKLPGYVIGGGLLLGLLALIGLWYLALFAIAALIFIVLWVIARKQHSTSRDLLQFRPGTMVPAEVWERMAGLPLQQDSNTIDLGIVELARYSDNWASFRSIAQVEQAGSISVPAYVISYQTPTADRGIIFAYDRLILGQVRNIEVGSIFDALWSLGGIFHVPSDITFGSDLTVTGATIRLPQQLQPSDGLISAAEQKAWNLIWRGIRGKSPE